MWASSNPWKVTSNFCCVSETKEEYIKCIERLRQDAPPEILEIEAELKSRAKSDIGHWDLIFSLESRVDDIEREEIVSLIIRMNSAARVLIII